MFFYKASRIKHGDVHNIVLEIFDRRLSVSDMLQVLAASMAQTIGEEEIVCRGMLRLTITSSVEQLRQITDPGQVTTQAIAYIKKMTYQDWKAVIEGPALSQNLANIGIADSATVAARLRQTLVEQQSLFTMTAR
jgi:hypothetical protein